MIQPIKEHLSKSDIARAGGPQRWLLGTAIGLLSLAGLALKASPSGLAWDAQSVQLVAESGEKEVHAHYHFRNASNVPITITSVTTDCGCTTAELSKKNYGPTEAGDVDVVFTVGDRFGVNEKTITVTTGEAGVTPVQLRLRVDIKALFSIVPRMVWWTVGEKPGPKSIIITSQSSRPIRVVAAKPTVPDIGAKIEMLEAGKKFRVLLEPGRTETRGTIPIELQIDVTGAPSQIAHVYALIR